MPNAVKYIPRKPPDTPFQESIWILPYTDADEPFVLDSTGITRRDPDYRIVRSERSRYFVLECILAGRGHLFCDNRHIQPGPGDVYLLPPDLPNEYYTVAADPWEKIWFNVSGVLVQSLVEAYQLQNSVLFRQCPLEEEFRKAIAIIAEHRPGAGEAFALSMHKIIALMHRHQRNMTFERGRKLAVSVRDYLHAHWRESPTLEQLGGQIERTPEQTLRIFRKEFGTTPMRYLAELRLNFARQYLLNTDYTLRTIAEEMGFRDSYYFAAWFKHQTGIAPGRFRSGQRGDAASRRNCESEFVRERE